jgi:Mn2+/Fe2+ NRAMP family transporter
MGDARTFVSRTLGPGLLFAGAAVGVSHLVQSTRAGALYGLGLALVVVAANVFKYPGFAFGPHYAAATGTSLLEGYRRQGTWALVLYALLTVGTMFTVLAVVTVVTAGLAKALLSLEIRVDVLSAAILVVCAAVLAVGRFRGLDRIMKVVVSTLTLMTVVATILALPRLELGDVRLWPAADQWNLQTAMFVAALVGWMPSAIDVSVWHSLWTLAKRRDTGHRPALRESLLDFQIGYFGTAGLALCFMVLGAALLHGTGAPLAGAPDAFAHQVIALYTETLGAWSRYVIGTCALLVMLSTTMTVIDGFPRALSALYARFRRPEDADASGEPDDVRRVYWIALAVIATGAVLILRFVEGKEFRALVDVATTLSFLTAPALAALNHRAVFGAEVPAALRPGPRMRAFSLVSITLLGAFALVWLYVRFVAS